MGAAHRGLVNLPLRRTARRTSRCVLTVPIASRARSALATYESRVRRIRNKNYRWQTRLYSDLAEKAAADVDKLLAELCE